MRFTLPKTLGVLAPVAVALAFAGGSSAVNGVHHATAAGTRVTTGVPRLGAIIPRRLPPFIVYDVYGNGTGIFLMKPDGSDSHQVGPVLPDGALEPSWSPRGNRILFQSGCAIWVMNADGSHPRVVVPGTGCVSEGLEHPHWSPDGRRIVYISTTGLSAFTIHIAHADGSHDHPVPNTEEADNASFSPDGRYLVFSTPSVYELSSHSNVWAPRIYLIRPNGTGLHHPRGWVGEDPSWSPDGTSIVYSCSLYPNPIILPPPPPGPPGPAPSPPAPEPVPHAVCRASRTHPTPHKIYSVPSDGSVWTPVWSADGKKILVTVGGGVALLSPSAGALVQITHTTGASWDGDPDW